MNPATARLVRALYCRLRGRKESGHLRRVEQEQWLEPAEIHRRQTRAIRDLLVHAEANVPFYRERFADAGFDPATLEDPEQIRRLPLLTKREIGQAGESIFAETHRREELQPYWSGGSTGEVVTVYRAREDMDLAAAIQRRLFRWHGFDLGDRFAMLWGALRDERPDDTWSQRLRNAFANELFLNAYDMTVETMKVHADRLRRFRPRALMGYVTPLFVFSQFLLEHGIESIRPRVVLTGAEPLFEHQRETIARAFGCPVRNTYGGREAGPMAGECPEGRLHLFEESAHFEFLRDGRPVRPGERGEVVITDLKKRGMPLIRYCVEDVAVTSSDPCPCGRGLATIDRVEGRTQDAIVTRTGQVITAELLMHAFLDLPIGRFQARQRTPDELVVQVVPGSGFNRGVIPVAEERMRGFIGPELAIRFEIVESIDPTPTGKHRFVISEVPR